MNDTNNLLDVGSDNDDDDEGGGGGEGVGVVVSVADIEDVVGLEGT